MKRLILIVFAAVLFCAPKAQAFWLWSPKTKKFTNPKWSAKQSPQAQLDYAKDALDAGNYKDAYREFKNLLRHFPEAREAAEAQFHIGACWEKMENHFAAYKAYQKVIDKYPFNELMDEVLERQFAIAEFLVEEKRKVVGVEFSQVYEAIEIYRQVIDNDPYGKLAALSQYRIGVVLKAMDRFDEAKQEFEKVVATYPNSEWFEAAKYQIAQSAASASLRSEYDQELTLQAKDGFQEFVSQHPQAELSQEARAQLQSLSDKQAEKDFKTAQFYERKEVYPSAQLYYEDVMRIYPQSIWAEKSKERIKILKEENKI